MPGIASIRIIKKTNAKLTPLVGSLVGSMNLRLRPIAAIVLTYNKLPVGFGIALGHSKYGIKYSPIILTIVV